MNTALLFNVFIFLAVACAVVPLASRLKLGSVLGYLVAGVVIGPFGFGFIEDAERIMHFAEFGVVMMLFLIGLELEPAVLWRLRKSILGLGGAQVGLSSLALTGAGVALGYDWRVSLAVGMALALSSTALVMQILQEKNLVHTPVGETAFSVLLFQDIAVIPILVLLPLLAGTEAQAEGLLAAWPGWARALAVACVVAGVIGLGRYGAPYFFRVIARTRLREMFTATSLALVVGITLLMQAVGVSPALGAFVAGLVLAGSPYRHTLEADVEPFKGLLLGLFFISVGMGMDFALLAAEPMALLALVVVLMGVKFVVLYVLGRVFGLLDRHNAGFALALAQGGEFAFVLFQFMGQLGLAPENDLKLLTLAVAISIALTPLFIALYSRYVVPRYMTMLPEREYDTVEERNPVIIAGFGRFGQVVGRFLSAQGVRVTVLEKDTDQLDLLGKFGYKGYFGDASRLDMLRAAGAQDAKLLIVAVDDADTGLAIARMALQEFPQLRVLARARNRQHAHALHQAGVHYFRRETFDSALTLAQEAMVALGKKESDMRFKAEQFMRHDEESLRQSFEFFDDEAQLVDFARLRREELERILQQDS